MIVEGYRLDLHTPDGLNLGELSGVEPGGTLTWNRHVQIRGGGRLRVRSHHEWDRVRVAPWYCRQGRADEPLGLFIARPISQTIDPAGRPVTDIALFDRTLVLAEYATTGAYTVDAGRKITDVVAEVIAATGEDPGSITETEEVTRTEMVWEPGTTGLRIVNDLLEAANYFSIWCDARGQFRVEPYQAPASRPVRHRFRPGPKALHLPEESWDLPAQAANRVVAISPGSHDEEAMVAVAERAHGPGSFAEVGRWITRVEDHLEAATQAILQEHADRLLREELAASGKVQRKAAFLPLALNDVVLADEGREVVEEITVTLTPGELMTITSREVA